MTFALVLFMLHNPHAPPIGYSWDKIIIRAEFDDVFRCNQEAAAFNAGMPHKWDNEPYMTCEVWHG